jgi:DNA invertase Pin-like site-specific DNA recombinase
MDAIIYRRVSTNEERQDIDRQLQPLLNYCKENNMTVIDSFKDSVSGSVEVEKRDGYSKMLKAVEKYKNKKQLNIVFDEISRLGRKKKIINNAIEYFTNQGINVHFLSPRCKMLDENGRIIEMADMVVTIFAQLAESELNNIKHRTITSVPRTAKKGHSLGGYFALGYTTDDNGKIIIHEEEAKLVKLIFEKYNSMGAVKVANFLRQNGYKTKMNRDFEPTTIIKIIQNRNYLGERVVLGEMYHIDAIIDEDLFNRANKRRIEKRNYQNHTRINVNPFVGILKCGCGSRIRVRKNSINKKRIRKIPVKEEASKLSYVCHNSNSGIKKCTNFGTIDYNLLCNSVLSFFEKIVADYTGDDEKIKHLNQELIIKQSEYSKVTKSILSLQDAEDVLFYEKSKANIDEARFNRLLKKLHDENKVDMKKEKLLKNSINNIEKAIELIESKKELTGINDIYDLKMFSQKFIKEIILNTVDRKILPEADKYYKDKRNVIYEIKLESNTDLTINFFTGSLSKIIYWKAYNRNNKESYKDVIPIMRNSWFGGEVLETVENPKTGDVYIVRKNLEVFDVRHSKHYNSGKESEIKKHN